MGIDIPFCLTYDLMDILFLPAEQLRQILFPQFLTHTSVSAVQRLHETLQFLSFHGASRCDIGIIYADDQLKAAFSHRCL